MHKLSKKYILGSLDYTPVRHEAIMLQKLSIMLLSSTSAPKITSFAFKKMPIIPKIMPPLLANNASL